MTPLDPRGGPGSAGERNGDPELLELFGSDPGLLELSRHVRAARPRAPAPAFEHLLRARLMDEAARRLRPHGLRRLLSGRSLGMVLGTGGAAVGVAMIAAVVATLVLYHPNDRTLNQQPRATSAIAGQTDVRVTEAIRVSFSQPMDHASVERGLEIQPATTYTVEWQGDDLIIHPTHPLAPNTPYSVSIPRSAARAAGGQVAAADVRIPFGTTTPPAPPSNQPTPPGTQISVLGRASQGSSAVFGGDGSVLAGSGLGGGGAARGGPDDGSAALRDYAGGTATRLGDAARALAVSGDGRHIALVRPSASGGDVVAASADGSDPQTLTSTDVAGTPLAWSSGGDRVLFVSAGHLRSVDLQRKVTPLGGPQLAPDQAVVLAAGGRYAYLGPSAGAPGPLPLLSTPQPAAPGQVIDLFSGGSTTLAGAGSLVAFSGDGTSVAWVDGSTPTPVLRRGPSAGGAPVTIPTRAASGDAITDLALNQDGSRFAYVLSHAGAQQLRVASLPDAALLGVVDGPAARLVFDSTGRRVAFLRASAVGGPVDLTVADLGGAGAVSPASTSPDVDTFLADLVRAQASGDTGRLRQLQATPDVGLDQRNLGQLTRGFVVSVAPTGSGSALAVHVRLVRDSSADSPAAAFSDETLTVDRVGADRHLAVTHADVPPLGTEARGPHVVHVDSRRATDPGQNGAVVSIQFDSDLDPSTIGGALTISTTGGGKLAAVTAYDATRRTVVATVRDAPQGQLHLTVDQTLRDVSGQALDAVYQAAVGG